ncbi:MAG: hypothetical protein IIB39_04745 [Candidatus Marinimicrobia bacterium]|nr:hypothetical protein [Candidatus Neomarinimicrobiota bacterium]
MPGYITSQWSCFVISLILPYLLLINEAGGAFEERLLSARASALGGSYSALPSDQLALFGNVANLTKQSQLNFSVIYSHPFGLKELSQSGLAMAIPSRFGAFGLSASRFGFSLYRENLLSVGYAKNPFKNISIGISLNLMEVRIKGYGVGRSMSMNSGILAELKDNLILGLTIRNLNSPTVSAGEESLPPSMRLGLLYLPASNFKVITEYQKERGFSDILRVGAEIELFPSQFLRLGVSNNPSIISMGFGLTSKGITIDYSAVTHQFLGTTQNISFGFTF